MRNLVLNLRVSKGVWMRDLVLYLRISKGVLMRDLVLNLIEGGGMLVYMLHIKYHKQAAEVFFD